MRRLPNSWFNGMGSQATVDGYQTAVAPYPSTGLTCGGEHSDQSDQGQRFGVETHALQL